jgi:hypothetical protein
LKGLLAPLITVLLLRCFALDARLDDIYGFLTSVYFLCAWGVLLMISPLLHKKKNGFSTSLFSFVWLMKMLECWKSMENEIIESVDGSGTTSTLVITCHTFDFT